MNLTMNYSGIIREIIAKRATAALLNVDGNPIITPDNEIGYRSAARDPSVVSDFDIFTIDLDDTLYYHEHAMEVFPEYINDICNITGLDPARVKGLIYSEHFRRLSIGSYDAFDWEDIVYTVAAKLKVNKRWNLEELQEKNYTPQTVYLLDGAVEFLNAIKGKALAATNGFSKYQLKIMDMLGIRPKFKGILSPDTTHLTKGDVEFYSKLKGLKWIHVGDDYFYDVEIPSLAGAKTIWIYGRGKFTIGGFQTLPTAMAPDLRSALKLLNFYFH